MRLSPEAHRSRPWRIHEIAPDFEVEDVWALPTPGGAGDFPRLVAMATALDASHSSSSVVRVLLPADLRGAPPPPGFDALPFDPLYLLDDEFAAEAANATMHGVLHLGWVPAPGGGYRGQLAVLVKRNGRLGGAYMAAIRPFRHLIVYPTMTREFARTWEAA